MTDPSPTFSDLRAGGTTVLTVADLDALTADAAGADDAADDAAVDTTRRIEYMDVDDVPVADRNPRHHDIPALVDSIRRFGFGAPAVLDERTGKLLAGHGRRIGVRRIRDENHPAPDGITTTPDGRWLIPVYRGWASRDDTHAQAMLVADNRITEKASWDERALAEMLEELSDYSLDLLHAAGFNNHELDLLIESAGAATDDDREPGERGDNDDDGDGDGDWQDKATTDRETAAAADPTAPRPSLADRFGIPPFDVMDARSGWWQARKKRWIGTGIKSEVGRDAATGGQAFTAAGQGGMAAAAAASFKGESGRMTTGGVLYQDPAANDPTFYAQKNAAEARVGRELTKEEFEADHYIPSETLSSGTSIFDPVVCELTYRWFSAPGNTVLDPFAGGSVRGLMAGMLGRRYVGNDLSARQVEANRAQAGDFLARGLLNNTVTEDIDDPTALTPVEKHGEYWIKRDDTFAVGGSAGGKVRSCLALASEPGVKGLVTAGSRQSPQVNIVATIAARLGLPCRVHVPQAKEQTPELAAAEAAGAEIVEQFPGYNNVIIARARDDAAERGWVNIPFGMECIEAVKATGAQVANIPASAKRLVVPVGSGMSLSGILHGLAAAGRHDLPVIGVRVGSDPTDRLDKWAPKNWRERVTLVSSELDYHSHAPNRRLGTVDLDPVYEAKCLPFIEPGDVLWVVGVRATSRTTYAPVPTWTVGDSREWVKTLAPESYDVLLTCPPYYDLEEYQGGEDDLSAMSTDDFDAAYTDILGGCGRALRPNSFAVVVVGDVRDRKGRLRDLRGVTVRAMEAAGLAFQSAGVLVTPVGSLAVRVGRQFESGRLLGRTHQDVLVFVKGDRKAAAARCGAVDVTMPEGVTDTADSAGDGD